MKKSLILLMFFMSFMSSEDISQDASERFKSESIKTLKKTLTYVTKFKNQKNKQIRKLNNELAVTQREFRRYKRKQKMALHKMQEELLSVKKALRRSKKEREKHCQKVRLKLTRVEKKLFQKERELKKERVLKKEKLQNIKKNRIEKESIYEKNIQEKVFVMKDLNQLFSEPMEVDNPPQIMTNEKNLPSAIDMAMEQAMNAPFEAEKEWIEVLVSE